MASYVTGETIVTDGGLLARYDVADLFTCPGRRQDVSEAVDK